jgi:hypothetical protein
LAFWGKYSYIYDYMDINGGWIDLLFKYGVCLFASFIKWNNNKELTYMRKIIFIFDFGHNTPY